MLIQINAMPSKIESIELQNFKSFKDSTEIKFNKLTILTGANSSGKSSIIQALVGALQSKSFPFLFSTNGKYINMGDFLDISYNHAKAGEVYINFSLINSEDKLNCKIKTGWKLNRSTKLPQLSTLESTTDFFNLKLKRVGSKFLADYDYYPDKDPSANPKKKQQMLDVLTIFMDAEKDGKKRKSKSDLSPQKIVDDQFAEKHIKNLSLAVNAAGFPIGKEGMFQGFKYLMDIFQNLDSKTNLISSFRLHPNRTHLESSQDSNKVKKFGEGYLDQIIRWENGNKKKFGELISHLKKLSLLNSIETSRIGGGRYDMLVTTNQNKTKVSLSDVGFGVSQFLPILVADLQMERESTLIVAQPEIHLHPNVQAEFADYLIGQIEKNEKNYIIETHSECFLNRVRLGIVSGKIKEEQLSVYYLENTKGDSKIHQLKFNKKGQIENAPKSFFDTYLMDLRNIALNAEL